MPLRELENLVRTGSLKAEPPSQPEFEGLLHSALTRLVDCKRAELAIASRFDLAYNASHALALAALRRLGYRSDNRYMVFQCLQHTLGVEPGVWRVLSLGHQKRNAAEYEGFSDVSEQLIKEMVAAADAVAQKLMEISNAA